MQTKRPPMKRLILRLAYYLDPEAWLPIYADLELGVYADLPEALAAAMPETRKDTPRNELLLIMRRLTTFAAASAYDKPELVEELHYRLQEYSDRPRPPAVP